MRCGGGNNSTGVVVVLLVAGVMGHVVLLSAQHLIYLDHAERQTPQLLRLHYSAGRIYLARDSTRPKLQMKRHEQTGSHQQGR